MTPASARRRSIKVTASLLLATFAVIGVASVEGQPDRYDELRWREEAGLQQLYQSTPARGGQPELLQRQRRQVTYANPQQIPPPQPTSGGGNVFGFLSNLGPQVEQASSSVKMFSSLFGSGSQAPSGQPGLPGAQSGGGPSASQILSQLTELVRSTQTRSANQLSSVAQDGTQQVQQGQLQATQAVQQAQSGMQAALTEVVQGLQRIAMGNPSLLPEIKNLFQRVSSRLSSAQQPAQNAFSGPIQPAKNSEQLADNLAKVALGQTQA